MWSDSVEEGFVDFDVLGFGGFGDENVRKDYGNGKENDDNDHALLQPTLRFAHPFYAAELILLGALRSASMVVI